MEDKKDNTADDTAREFDENPYDPDNKRPEDIVRLFYSHNLPIIPVVSKRGILIGILQKEDVISELSDLERAEKLKVDDFITSIARKMTLDKLLEFGTIKEFTVINLFGEVQGTWPRIKLFAASEKYGKDITTESETARQKEEQVLEWMIYLILEHIPRALYAVNSKGKTIFYNSYFEDLYGKSRKGDVDTVLVEKTLKDSKKNDPVSGRKKNELTFYNKELKIYYEKIPLSSKGKKVGFLIFCSDDSGKKSGNNLAGIDTANKSLKDILESVERQVIIDSLAEGADTAGAAKKLGISKKSLQGKIDKHAIDLKKK